MTKIMQDILIGLFIAIVGGTLVAWIIQDGERFQPPSPPPLETSPPSIVPTQRETTSTVTIKSTIYDDFENTTNDNLFNQQLWRLTGTSSNPKAYQQEGKLTITDDSSQEDVATILVARSFDGFTIETPFFFETELALSGENTGSIHIGLYNTTTLEFGDWSALCNVSYGGEQVEGFCSDSAWPQKTDPSYTTPLEKILPNTWHTFRIEVDPKLFKITYYLDGTEIGSHIPEEAEALKAANFQVAIGIWKHTKEGTMFGQFDNVSIGEISQ